MIKFLPRFDGIDRKMKGMQQSTTSCEHNEAIKQERTQTTKKLERKLLGIVILEQNVSKCCVFFRTFAYPMLKCLVCCQRLYKNTREKKKPKIQKQATIHVK